MAELKDTLTELKRNQERIKELKAEMKECNAIDSRLKEEIKLFLEENGKNGDEFDGVVFYVEKTESRPRKKKSEKQLSMEAVLRKYGVANAKRAAEELMESTLGEKQDKQKVVVKQAK